MKYTEMELKVIEVFRNSFNYDTLEDNLNDNCTCLLAKEVAEDTGLNIKSVKGVFGSLEKKGLIFVDEFNFGEHATMVTDEGLREYYRLFETEESKEETNMAKVIERATGNEFNAKKIEGGYEVFTLEGEKYKKLKDSTFKKYFKPAPKTAEKQPQAEEPKAKKKAAKKAEPTVELTGEKKEKMIEKIRKVLELAKDNPSMEEGLAAALQAQKLMHKYNIHEEDVTLEEVKDDITSVFSQQKHNSHLMAWRKQLAVIVARNFRCKAYIHNQDVVFRGYTADAKVALDVYMYLYTLGHKLACNCCTEQYEETGTVKGAYNSFATGFLKGIEEGLGEQCTALMIVVPKAVEEEFEQFSAGFKTTKTSLSVASSELYHKGKREGKAAVKARQVEAK